MNLNPAAGYQYQIKDLLKPQKTIDHFGKKIEGNSMDRWVSPVLTAESTFQPEVPHVDI